MDYPWYESVSDTSLAQGDIFAGYPIFVPKIDGETIATVLKGGTTEIQVGPISTDVIVVSQSCDLTNNKIDSVILCPVWPMSKVEPLLGSSNKERTNRKEAIRRGNEPQWHLLNASGGGELPLSVVEFRRIHSTPKDALKAFAEKQRPRLRLCPPYREHLSQAFARYFMRVGLPVDIPPFKVA